ncbi:MAG TPA: winged helix-turn-helix domain-containing protein [Thermoleophilaceae bacterium]|nr:winged helix-turn-helix domain-containing protein [Thermoleophilaceae bacterium]
MRRLDSAGAESSRGYGCHIDAFYGDADIAAVARLVADDARSRILTTLADGRALPASLLASEAGIARSTASEHLAKLVGAGLVTVHPQGRHRYFRLSGPEVASLLESLARFAPPREVRSLRESTRADALRRARSCYDHLAGRLGVRIFAALIEDGAVTGGDGVHRLDTGGDDRLSAPGRDVAYRLTPHGAERLARLGVATPKPAADGTVPLRYCVDWTEQRHHLSGVVGRALLDHLLASAWVERDGSPRALRLTDAGRRALRKQFGARVLG